MQSSHIVVVDNILIQEKHIENVNNFVYLGSSIPNVKKDIEIRIAWTLIFCLTMKIHLVKQIPATET